MPDRIEFSGQDHRAGLMPMAIGNAVVIVQKGVNQRCTDGKVSDG